MLCGLILAVGCTYDSDIDTSGFGSEGDGVTTVNIRATLPEFGGVTRGVDSAKGGTTNIDWGEYSLRVIIKAFGDESEPEKYRGKVAASEVLYLDDTDVGTDGSVAISIDMPLTSDHTYDIYLWADYVKKGSEEDLHYNTASFPAITFNYTEPVINDESLDAFYGKAEITVGDGYYVWTEGSQFQIYRAVAKLRMVATDADTASAVSATLQTDKFYTGFNIATEELTESDVAVKSDKTTFETYTDESSPATKSFITAYMLWPAEESTKIVAEFYEEGNDEAISTIEPANAIPLKRGNLTTLCGALLVTDSGWDGETYEEPMTIDGDWLVVQNAEELAWVLKEADTKGKNKVRIAEDMDMGGNTVKPFPINVVEFDGAGHKISNLAIDGNSLFAVEKTLSIHDLDVDEIAVGGVDTEGHVGVLLDEVKLEDGENVTYSNVSISNATVTTKNGAAGGLIGYIGRATENDRASEYTVTIDNCHLTDVVASANVSEGYLVGLFSGYDSSETLIFNDNCSITTLSTRVDDHESPYIDANKATWLSGVDFSKYDGWLGDEKYMRGTIKFGANTYVRKWDGVTTVEPLLANPSYDTDVTSGTNKFVVYSPFDLAGVRSKTASPAAIYLRSDIDMNGQGADGKYNVPSNFTQSKYTSTDDNVFNPFSYVTTLDGKKDGDNNFSIYNLSIAQIEQERAAFVLYASGTTSHKNINFKNCQTVAVHKPVATDAKAYGAILVANVDATYTMENVHAHDCRVFALQKVGTLGARISGTSTLKNCTVNNCYVENYECMISERFTSGVREIAGFTVEVYAVFYPHGEVGGMFGFIQGNSSITNCRVNGTTVYAFGQNDKMATVEGDAAAKIGIALLGYYLVPGRHVGTLIGNIRATGAVTITNSGADSSSKCTNRADKHQWRVRSGGSWLRPTYTYYTYDYIGQAYYVEFLDNKGSVTVDGTSITLGDCKDNTLYGTH